MEKIHKEILGLMGKVDINCRDENGIVIVDLEGQIDIYNSLDLEKLIDAYVTRGLNKFVMNLEEVNYLDSSAISVFIHCHQKLKKQEGWFLLASLQGSPKEVFDMAKLHEVLNLYPDVPSALQHVPV